VEPNDLDGDGMPKWWEDAHGLDKDDPSDAGLDGDSDTLTNLDEFGHGTDLWDADTDGDGLSDGVEVAVGLDPLDPFDCIAVLDISEAQADPNWMSLTWLVGPGKTITIYWTGDLPDDVRLWDAVDGPALDDIVDNGDGTWTWTDKGTDLEMMGQAPGDVKQRFYRVKVG
jgi:hypothetical protein